MESQIETKWLRLSDLQGQDKVAKALARARLGGRVHHAYLFHGPEGVGKLDAAFALTALANCTALDPVTAEACGTCATCRKLKSGQHPDVVVVEPAGRFFKIEQVRAINKLTRFQPWEAKQRVVIVNRPETMRDEAANALLKTLEEPSGDTIFVLVSSEAHRLLNTIVSRCQPVRFSMLSTDHVQGVLEEEGYSVEEAQLAARLAGGSLTRSRALLEHGLSESRQRIHEVVRYLLGGRAGQLLPLGQELAESRSSLEETLAQLRGLYRDALLHSAGVPEAKVVNLDLLDAVRMLSVRLGRDALLRAVERINEAERLLAGNVNPRMVAETMLLNLAVSDEG